MALTKKKERKSHVRNQNYEQHKNNQHRAGAFSHRHGDRNRTGICIYRLINIRLPFAPQGGLIHLGNVPLFIFAILFGKKTGAIAGGVGMGLFDLLSGWTAWAPFTFVIVGCMGFVMGWITEKKQGFQWYVVAMFAACAIKIGGYYIAEGIIYGNWITPVTSIPGNLLQIGTAAVIVLITIAPLKKVAAKLWN